MIRLLAHPLPPSSVSKLDPQQTGKTEKERQLAEGREGEGGGRGAESNDRKKAWSSINYFILYDTMYVQ
jgi:hypothetical protein